MVNPIMAGQKLVLTALLVLLTSRECSASPRLNVRDSASDGWNVTSPTTTSSASASSQSSYNDATTSMLSTKRSTTSVLTTESLDSVHQWRDWKASRSSHPTTQSTTTVHTSASPDNDPWGDWEGSGSGSQPHGGNGHWPHPGGHNDGSQGNPSSPSNGHHGGNSGGDATSPEDTTHHSGGEWNNPTGGSSSPGRGSNPSGAVASGGSSVSGSGTSSYTGGPYGGGSWNVTGTNGWNSTHNSTDDGWNPDEGVPPLSADAITFIVDEEALALSGFPDNDTLTDSGANSTVTDDADDIELDGDNVSSNFSGEITREKWIQNDMDTWLINYVQRVPIAGRPGTRLMDSTHFFRDFWLSTGEENIVVCESLYDSCNVASIDDSKRYPYISKDDAYRAQFVRQVLKVWQSGNRQAYQIISQAVTNSQITISTAHRVFLQNDPPKTTSILDVILPALAAVTVFAPTLAPAVSLLSNIYAAVNTVSRRDEDAILPRDLPKVAGHSHEKRATDNVISDILDRVQTLEKKSIQSWVDDVNKGVEKSGKAIDQAAKAVVALKALNPKVAPSTISSWDFFDARVFNDLESYPITHLQAFEKNILTWAAREDTGTNGPIAVAGMKSILLGGEWAKINANKDPDSVTIPKVKAFLTAMIFMQVVQNQAIYFWTQALPSESQCQSAATAAKSKGWLASDGWYECANIAAGKWEFRMARRPMRNEGEARVVNDLTWNPFGDILRVAMFPGSTDTCFVQKKTWFEQNSAGLSNYNGDLFTAANYDFKIADVFAGSMACQTALGDPFGVDLPPQSSFYPAMQVQVTAEKILSGALPLCLFNVPVFQVGDPNRNNWCKYGLGGMHGAAGQLRSYYRPDLDTCDYDIVYWALQSDNKICLTDNRNYRSSSWVARPGCERHDRGIHLVGYRRA